MNVSSVSGTRVCVIGLYLPALQRNVWLKIERDVRWSGFDFLFIKTNDAVSENATKTVLLPITLITLTIIGVLHSNNSMCLSLLCLWQLFPSIVAPWIRKHNVRTARRMRPQMKQSRGRSRDPGSVFGHVITNRKSLQAGHTGQLPSFVYWGGGD